MPSHPGSSHKKRSKSKKKSFGKRLEKAFAVGINFALSPPPVGAGAKAARRKKRKAKKEKK